MDLDDQELFYTQYYKHLYKEKDFIRMKKIFYQRVVELRKQPQTTEIQKEIKDLLGRIDICNKNIDEIER
jgi:hypothetical protein